MKFNLLRPVITKQVTQQGRSVVSSRNFSSYRRIDVIVDSELAVRIRRRRRSRRRSVATTDKFDLFRTSFAQGYCVFMFWGIVQMFEYRRTIERDFYERFGLVKKTTLRDILRWLGH
ncbi:hypothetical protein Bca101_084367 [Brassica carinata]